MQKIKNILITGGAGFIGSALARRLVKSKNNIHLILRKTSNTWRIRDILDKINIYYADLNNALEVERVIEKIKPNTIYHLATYSNYTEESCKILETNIFGTYNLLNACQKTGFDMFVNIGSSSEYGAKVKPMSENDLLEPNSYYATAKAWQTLFCQHLAREKNLPIITLRLFSVYGHYEAKNRLIPTLINNCLQGKDLDLASPKIARDFVFVDDVVDVCIRVARFPKLAGRIFNIGSGQQSTFKELVSNLIKLTKANVKQNWGVYPKRSQDNNCWVADMSQTKKLLKWEPKHSLQEGLKKTIKWFKENQNNVYK